MRARDVVMFLSIEGAHSNVKEPDMRAIGRAIVVAASTVAALGMTGGTAWAQAQPSTMIEHNATDTFHDEVPCVGPATITITYNAVEHTTTTATGFHETSTQTGTFSAVLDDGSGTATGKFTMWDGFNSPDGVNGEGTFNFSGHVSTGPGAGTNWHDTAHFTGPLAEGSTPKVAFDRFRCF